MTAPETELRLAWRDLVGRHHEEAIERVLLRYAEPHRRYHTGVHVMWVLRHVDQLAQAGHADTDLARSLRAAALFHDVVYEPASATNEVDSARYAERELLDAGWQLDAAHDVGRLIEATDSHDAACELPGSDVLFDADLAILGSSPADYAASVVAIRHEYNHVDDASWRSGRTAVLRSFLARPLIYRTTTMRVAREDTARANLTAELSTLA